MDKNKIRKALVSLFILVGLGGIYYENSKPAPVVYEGTGEGYNDKITVKITAKRNSKNEVRILKVEAINEDTPAIAGPALEKLISQTLAKQSYEVDAVSGATYTSEGYKEGLKKAVESVK
ncbi:MAG: FMN-binding protein [Cetobacterium sp.]|uniref:FMN-binding protein n=1 Tax=unclassified Cetobacterium TaxID=2630983 RepID=UPI00163D2B6F|nr:FMN-binding protein [Cetobacterium sp. 2A]MBC2856260.1 FMN-binding protein [Cetobacterium sp. 2A]